MTGLYFDSWEEEQQWREQQHPASRPKPSLPIHRPPQRPPTNINIEPARGGKVGKTSWVIRDFLHRGALVYLAAEAGSGKSTILYRAAEAITTGQLFLHQLPVTQGRVLVIQGDEPPTDAASKFRLMDLHDTFDIAFVDPPLDMEWMAQQISGKQYDAIFLDSATTLLATDDREVTDQSFARQLYRLGKAFAQHQVSGLITAHLNKPSDGQVRRTITRHDIAGVAAISAAVTDIWGLWRDPRPEWEDHFNLLSLGKRYCRTGTLWQLQGSQEDFSWHLRRVADGLLPQEHLSLQQRIIDHLATSDHPLSCAEVAAAVRTSYEYARRCCTDLFSEGRIQRTRHITGQQGRPSWLYTSQQVKS